MKLAAPPTGCFPWRMSKGLDSFDGFAWESLLAGREVLVCDEDGRRALKTANALEAAGARATVAESQRAARDWMARRPFALVVVALEEEASLEPALASTLSAIPAKLMLIVDPERRESARQVALASFADARVASFGMSERQLVMFVTGTSDE